MSKQKEKFFCLYHGQNIMKCATPSGYSKLMKVDFVAAKNKAFFLELTPLRQINDEDAFEVAKIINKHVRDAYTGEYVDYFKDEVLKDPEILGLSTYRAVDYLRSKGYALPWNGIAVEEQIKLGWIKLKDNE